MLTWMMIGLAGAGELGTHLPSTTLTTLDGETIEVPGDGPVVLELVRSLDW